MITRIASALWTGASTINRPPVQRAVLVLLPLYLSRMAAEYILPDQPVPAALFGLIVGLILVRLWNTRQRQLPAWSALVLLPAVIAPAQSPTVALVCGVILFSSWVMVIPWRLGWILDAGLFAVALIIFSLTLAHGAQPADAGEFQLVIAQWGVAHPPGYPLYTMLGGLFAHLVPLLDLPTSVNLFSALTAALTLVVLARTIRAETSSPWAGLLGAGVLASATSYWTTATQASIRPMTALFAALMVSSALAYRRAIRDDDIRQIRRTLVTFGLAAGFGVTHHVSLVFPGTVLAFSMAVAQLHPLGKQLRRWGAAFAAALAGALPWAYLLERGAANAPLAPTNLATWDGFWQHVLARGFAGDMFYYRSLVDIEARLGLMAQVLTAQWHLVILVLAVGAVIWLALRDRWLLMALGGAFVVHTFVAATYRAPQTVEYMIPAYVCLATAIGWAAGKLRTVKAGHSGALMGGVIAAAILLSAQPTWISLRAYQQRDQTDDNARILLQDAPQDSTILANWHNVTPLWLLQSTEGLRDDLTIEYVAPQGAEPILDTWTRLIADHGEGPLISCSYYPESFRHLNRAFSAVASCWQIDPAIETAFGETAISLEGLSVFAHLVPDHVSAGEPLEIVMDWKVDTNPDAPITTFVHIVNQAGQLVAQSDEPLTATESSRTIAQRYTVFVPRTAAPGTYTVYVGAYTVDADGSHSLSAEDGSERVQVGEVQVGPALIPPITSRPVHVQLVNGPTLIGYDYDLSVPGRARLYLHWDARQSQENDLTLTISSSDGVLNETTLVIAPGFVTTAYDLPDAATINGLTFDVHGAGGAPLSFRGIWGFQHTRGIAIEGPSRGERYIPVGNALITSYQVGPDTTTGETIVKLTIRSVSAVTQDVSYQLSQGNSQSFFAPGGGALPSLKWGWNTVIHETLRVPLDPSALNEPVTLTLFDTFTSQAWPILDPGLSQFSPNLPLR